MFLRTKKINGNSYCYLVENKHTSRGPRQKVKKYLGRAYGFEEVKELDFFGFLGVSDLGGYFKKRGKEIISDLIKFELVKHGFKEKDGKLVKKKINFNIKNNRLFRGEKEVLLSLNEGFLCSYTLSRILRFKKSGDLQTDGLKLAKYFVEAGFKVPQEVFVGFYGKL